MAKKVALGMSGGVDSSLSAVFLKEQGYAVTGVFLECWRAPGCRAEEDRKDALAVALKLGIPFKVLDFKNAYKEKVVEYFFREYEAGRTPNPDVLCNKEIKFGLFYSWAMENGFDYVATGHYAQIRSQQSNFGVLDSRKRGPAARDQNQTYRLLKAQDEWKDQTYFLYRLRDKQLAHVLFPIGYLLKSEVRKLATQKGLPVAAKPDSQGICFIGEINVHNFLKERLGERPGDVVDTKGRKIGSHKGLWFYTIGQRHGFEVAPDNNSFPPYYVIRKDVQKNQLVVGFGAETFQDSFEIEDVHWITSPLTLDPVSLSVRIRHTGKLLSCSFDGRRVHLRESAQGIATGQSAVFYQNDVCLGGGIIV